MSEYQFYEFQTVDKPLSESELAKIDALSSRVELSATRAAFVYHYSNLRADPKELLAQHFDAYLYISNWGTRQLMFRFPAGLVDISALRPFELEYAIKASQVGSYVILDLTLNDEEGGGWIEDGEFQLSPYLGLRSAILNGDYRGVYIAWLGIMEHAYEMTDDDLSPPIPDGLGQLDAVLKNTSTFFEVDPTMLQAAAKHSQAKVINQINIREAVAKLSTEEKDDFLIRLAENESLLNTKFVRHLQPPVSANEPSKGIQPTIAQLRADAEVLREAAAQKAAAEAEEKRLAALEALAKRENVAWTDVQRLIEDGKGNAYKNAVALLVQLRELAHHRNKPSIFEQRISNLREKYQRKRALIKRLNDAQL